MMTNISSEELRINYQPGNRLVFSIVFATLIFWLFAQSLLVTLHVVREELYFSDTIANLSLSVTTMVSGCLILLCGGLADRFGRLLFIRLGLALNIVSCLTLITTENQYIFFVGRIISGVSAACILSSTLGTIRYFFDGNERQRAISYAMMGSFGGSSLSTLFASSISYAFGWRTIFILSILLSIITYWMLWSIPETERNNKKPYHFDAPGLLCLFLTVISLSFLTQPLPSKTRVVLVITCILSSCCFVYVEKRKKDLALVNLSLLSVKPFRSALLVNFILNTSIAFVIISNTFLVKFLNLSLLYAGLVSLGFPIIAICCMRLGEALFRKVGARFCVSFGVSLCAFAMILASVNFLGATVSIIFMVLSYSFFGLGLSMQATAVSYTAISSIPTQYGSLAGASMQMGSSIGGALGIASMLSLFTFLSETYSIDIASRWSLWVMAIVQLVNILLILYAFSPKQLTQNATKLV